MTALFSAWSTIYSPLGGAFFNVVPVDFNGSVTVTQTAIGAWDPPDFWHDFSNIFFAVGVGSLVFLFLMTG
jgi:hypothetical protein